MKYAVIAAGEGSRLVQEGVTTPKPLIELGGERLIDRLIRIFMANDACEIVVISNEQMTEVAAHLQRIQHTGRFPLQLVVKSTPSSMHSLWELRQHLCEAPFVLTTVDTIFHEQAFTAYVRECLRLFREGTADGLMGVTDYIDDEKPLFVSVDDAMRITAFQDHCDTPHFVSAGIYGLRPESFATLERCVGRGESCLRNFQRALVDEGLRLKAYPFAKVLDIDHASDIVKAKQLLGV